MKRIIIMFIFINILIFGISCNCNGMEKTIDDEIMMAKKMDFDKLCKKAIKESNGKEFLGIGVGDEMNESLSSFVKYLKTIDKDYTLNYRWDNVSDNSIFDKLQSKTNSKDVMNKLVLEGDGVDDTLDKDNTSDSNKDNNQNSNDNSLNNYSFCLVEDINLIQSKLLKTGLVKTYTPKAWIEDLKDETIKTSLDMNDFGKKVNNNNDLELLALHSIAKVFVFNNTKGYIYNNCWDFVFDGEEGLAIDIDKETIGKNFLMMLTNDTYSMILKKAYDELPSTKKSIVDQRIEQLKDSITELNLGQNSKYSLAWISMWLETYKASDDEESIINELLDKESKTKFGLVSYSKLNRIDNTDTTKREVDDLKNLTIASYLDGSNDTTKYNGIGGFLYNQYVFLTSTCKLPYTACCFISYLTRIDDSKEKDIDKVMGYNSFGKNIGVYSLNPRIQKLNDTIYNHKVGGYINNVNTYEIKNDRGYQWWKESGGIVVEDHAYLNQVMEKLEPWINSLKKQK